MSSICQSLNIPIIESHRAEADAKNSGLLFVKILKKSKGLHSFMNWDNLILTDSGGFQIYSLKGLRKIQADGAIFQSHLDGNIYKLTPKSIVDIQRIIGSDIMMMLDVVHLEMKH